MALRDDRVTLAHGGGGKAMRDLIEEVFTDVFEPPGMEDQARLEATALAAPGARLAFTTGAGTPWQGSFVMLGLLLAGVCAV